MPVINSLAPKLAVVFVAFLIAGMAMPVLPLHVHGDLGFGTFVVGLVSASQFLSSLTTRIWAGDYADRRGPKNAVIIGLATAAVAGAIYMTSNLLVGVPALSATVLIIGRGVLGGAESLIITGSVAWGLATAGPRNAGKVIAWVGTAMFGALAAGAPIGTALYAQFGFGAIAVVTIVISVIALLAVRGMTPVPGRGSLPGASRLTVIGAVWLPGLGSALSSIGYGAILTFSLLLFVDRQWPHPWMTVTCFAAALVLSRLFVGHLPDRLGGPQTALVFILVEVLGLVLLGTASTPIFGLVGAAIVGLGYSMVFPGFGIAVVGRAPAENRGMAMGLYSACLDLSLAVSGPLLGVIGSAAGLSAIFLVSAALVACAAPVAIFLLLRSNAAISIPIERN